MFKPLLQLVTEQPHLLVDHVQAYADLLGFEVNRVCLQWRRRLLLGAVALCSLGVAVLLAGVAVMLAATLDPHQWPAPWVLVVTPLLPLMLALGCCLAWWFKGEVSAFEEVKSQIYADFLMLQKVGAS
jgi:hypothetical protein